MPTFSPMSEARGRALGVVFWAAANAVANKTVATAKSLLAMGIAYDQIPLCWQRLVQKSKLPLYFCFRLLLDFGKQEVTRLLPDGPVERDPEITFHKPIRELVKRGCLSERCWIHPSRASPLNRGFPLSEFRNP